MSPTLYALSADFAELDRMLDESGGELTPEIETVIGDLGLKERSKVDHLGQFIRETEARETAVKAERDTLAARGIALANKAKSLKRLCQMYLDARGIPKVEGEVFTIAKQKNGGKPPIVFAADVAAKLAAGVPIPEVLPPMFVRTRVEHTVNLDALREMIEAGHKDAVELAAIGDPGFHVRVR